MPRIIAGEFRGRRIISPRGTAVRPTSDRVKEALFQMIDFALEGASVLDLYAGSGNLGLEALSRGARACCFVDAAAACIAAIRRNVDRLDLGGRATLMRLDCARAVRLFRKRGERFELIVADPPYGEGGGGEAGKMLCTLDSYDILSQPSLIVVEHSRNEHIPGKLKNLALYKKRRYGDTILSFFEPMG